MSRITSIMPSLKSGTSPFSSVPILVRASFRKIVYEGALTAILPLSGGQFKNWF